MEYKNILGTSENTKNILGTSDRVQKYFRYK